MSVLAAREENEITKFLYYKMSGDGYILPDRVLELEKFRSFFSEDRRLPLFMPFSPNSLVSMMSDGSFYTAWSEDFTIKKYDGEGNYLQSFYLPYENARLSISKINLNEHQRRILREYDTPQTWQALYTIETDEENRLWVSTITESDSTFQWWVINEEGDVMATFHRPGKRSDISVVSKPLYKIRNGYFYEREFNYEANIDRIVKYKIELTNNRKQ